MLRDAHREFTERRNLVQNRRDPDVEPDALPRVEDYHRLISIWGCALAEAELLDRSPDSVSFGFDRLEEQELKSLRSELDALRATGGSHE